MHAQHGRGASWQFANAVSAGLAAPSKREVRTGIERDGKAIKNACAEHWKL